ncbi:MAG: alpha/beta hydrolase domain-containing protein [Gammaproteobacteria bacterium]|nr:alpha/beta hydrolase domain-containing protein [Gammaproteobacteria bacterium]
MRLEIVRREPFEAGRAFGDTGPYERIDAVAHYAVDPAHPANAAIVDLDRAERASDGRVHFSGDANFLVPIDPARANRALLLDVPNRGNRIAMRSFNMAPFDLMPTDEITPGDGFLLERGWCIAWCGWQWDVPHPSVRLGLRAPAVPREKRTPPGRMQLRIQPDRATETFALTDHHVGPVGNHAPIPTEDPDDADAVLWVREHLLDDAPVRIPRDRWAFARPSDGDGDSPIPDSGSVWLAGGFAPGRIYDLVYTPAECPVVGAGLLAVRDLAAWARVSEDAPTAGRVDHAIAQGVSQCGRFLRTFLHAGLNRDEDGRRVFDGVHVHVAGGRRGEFNHRYGQPSVQPTPSLGHRFPFADEPQTDTRSGHRAGLLDRQRALGCVPKIFHTDTSSEYWRGDAGLTHHDLESGADVEPPEDIRRYLFASTQHGPGALPFTQQSMFGSHGANRLNVVDYRPLFRAALENLRAWIADGIEPPESVFPRARDATAASREEVLSALARIPGATLPRGDRLPSLAPMNLGERADEGVPALPATFTGAPYPALVSAVDGFGNETGGLRMPDVAIPVATHTGFNPRHPDTGGDGQILEYLGSTVPLARTAAAREAASDPRPSIAERYASRDAYLAEVRAAAQRLVEARYLLAGDIELCVALAGERFDAVVGLEVC